MRVQAATDDGPGIISDVVAIERDSVPIAVRLNYSIFPDRILDPGQNVSNGEGEDDDLSVPDYGTVSGGREAASPAELRALGSAEARRSRGIRFLTHALL